MSTAGSWKYCCFWLDALFNVEVMAGRGWINVPETEQMEKQKFPLLP